MLDAEVVLHWWQLPDSAPLGVVRQVAQRNALVAIASRAVGDRVEAAALIAIGEFLAAARDAKSIEIPKGALARQNLLEPAMLHPAGPVCAAVVLLWQAAMESRRAEWGAETAEIMAKWSAPVPSLPRPSRRRRAPRM